MIVKLQGFELCALDSGIYGCKHYSSLPYHPKIYTIIINKGGQVTKPIIVVKISYKLLYVIQVVKKIFDK